MNHSSEQSIPIDLSPPLSYIVVKRAQKCFCGSYHESTELYYEREAKSRWGRGTVLNLQRIDGNKVSIEHKLPVKFRPMTVERIPFCIECYDHSAALARLPEPPLPEPKTLLNSISKPDEPHVTTSKLPRTTKPTLNDIFASLE